MLRGKAALIRTMKARATVEGQTCSYSHRTCTQPRLDGYEFCLKHILEDKNSPYKQCSYTAPKTNRRCTNAAPKLECTDRREGFCMEHQKRAILSRQRASRKRRPKETAETLLEELATSNATASDTSMDTKRLRRLVDSVASKALEYASSSDSDTETLLVDQAWRRDNESDAESIDSEQEDPLKHAGVYSQEEAALLLRDKLIRLQSLYIEQFKRLQHVLKEKRRKYLHTYKLEREMLGPIQAYKLDPTQCKKYKKLQAMKRYHKFFGKEALLHQKCNNRRIAVAEGVNHRPPTFNRCVAPSPDGRCNKRVVPLSKFCMAHILKDPHQVLFEPCRFRSGACGAPVFSLDDFVLCRRHYAAITEPTYTTTASQTEELPETEIKVEPSENVEVCGSPSSIPNNQVISSLSTESPSVGNQELCKSESSQNRTSSGGEEILANLSEQNTNSSLKGNSNTDDGDASTESENLIKAKDK